MAQLSGFIIFSLVATLCYFVGVLQFLAETDSVQECKMTYMFESVQFVKIANKADEKYRRYGLYAYSEGRLTEKARRMHFDGIPVLFIPGNAGSHKQVRSLASIALRKALDARLGYHFDYFTVDLNNEFSAFSGHLLNAQLDYVNESIYQVLQLYEKQYSKPVGVILIGHSMGGVLAEYVTATLPPESKVVTSLIKLSSPSRRCSLYFDLYLRSFYDKLNSEVGNIQSNTPIISVFGGFNDFLVPPHLSSGEFSVSTTNIPKAWMTTDHLSILWCKDVVLAINRALFDAVDYKTRQITTNKGTIMSAFHHHLYHHSGTKFQYRANYLAIAPFPSGGQWIETLHRQHTANLASGVNQRTFFMTPLSNQPHYEMLTIVALNMKTPEWVYACSANIPRGNSRVCVEAVHLTQYSQIAPSLRYKRRIIHVRMHELLAANSNATHVVARVQPTSDPVILHFDSYKDSDRRVEVILPSWYQFFYKSQLFITAERAITYTLVLPQLHHIIQYFQLYIEPIRCSAATYHTTASLQVPWSLEQNHGYFTETQKKPMTIRLYSSRPIDSEGNATISLTLDQSCVFSVSIKPSFLGTMAHIARYYSGLIIGNVAVVILMSIRKQLMCLSENKRCCIFFSAVSEGAKPYYILTVAKIVSKVLSFDIVHKFIPGTDWHIIQNDNIDFILLPLIVYLISVGLVWLLVLSLSIGIVCFESVCNKLTLKFLSKSILGFTSLSDYFMKGFKKVPGIIAAFLIFLTFSTCGGLAIWLSTIFYFLKLTQMSQDCIESFIWKIAKMVLKQIRHSISKRFKGSKKSESQALLHTTEKLAIDGNILLENYDKSISPPLEEPTDDSIIEAKHDLKASSISNCEESTSQTPSDNKLEVSTPLESTSPQESARQKFSSWFSEFLENNEIYFHFSIFLLYLLTSLLNMPSVLTWAHNFRFNRILQPDPSFVPGFVLSICVVPLWHLEFPKVEKRFYKELSVVIYILALFTALNCTISIYRLSYVLTLVVILLVLHQILAPTAQAEDNEGEPEDEIIGIVKETFEEIKSKME